MDYPIYVDEKEAGRLSVETQGLYTRFFARFTDPGRLIRLCVYGEGKEAVLGVAAPENGELVLERRFSRFALRDFPLEIEYAAPQGEPLRPQMPEEPPVPAVPEEAPTEAEAAPKAEAVREAAPEAESAPEKDAAEEPELIWYRRSDGSLTTTWQDHRYVAVPLDFCSGERERMLETRVIEGREYGIFEGETVD